MKQFQKLGVAAAVASVAAGTVAEVSRTETGDLAIIPYYTVLDGVNTGMHIINTTDQTQVVKVRLRRATDSKDALDFNLVMSPRDEWTANIGAGGSTGVVVTTNDNTCTVPAFPEGGAEMPSTYADGATEGYVEVIGMGQPTTELSHLAIGAEHTEAGVPFSCDIVRQNFYRVAADDVGDASVRGVHTSGLVSSGVCTGVNTSIIGDVTALGVCALGTAQNLTALENADDDAFKVSFMLTDPAGGLEAGDNAVMVSGFSSAPMMTNQQPLSFGTDNTLDYDPLNFELPNLAYGAGTSSVAARQAGSDASILDGSMRNDLADDLDADSIANDWAAFDTDTGTVNADWVVTLPGQYVMVDPICELYNTYSEATNPAATACAAYLSAGDNDQNQLPLLVASNVDGGALITGSNLNLWNREELPLTGEETPPEIPEDELGFSPGGTSGDPDDPDVNVLLPNEVNVIAFGSADADSAVMSNVKLTVTPPSEDRGWGRLDIESTNDMPMIWNVGVADAAGAVDGGNLVPGVTGATGAFGAVGDATDTAVVGFAVWQRTFADQAGNYGRMIEHSTITSGSTTR